MTFIFRCTLLGEHIHVRLFANCALAGSFVLRTDEFDAFKRKIVVSPSGVATQQDVFKFEEA